MDDKTFLEYLQNDVVQLKTQNELIRRESAKWLYVIFGLCLVMCISIVSISTAAYLVSVEHTKQIQILACLEVRQEVETVETRTTVEDPVAAESVITKGEGDVKAQYAKDNSQIFDGVKTDNGASINVNNAPK